MFYIEKLAAATALVFIVIPVYSQLSIQYFEKEWINRVE